MILDSQLNFDPLGTAITAGGASTNVLDMVNPRDMAIGTPLKLLIVGSNTFAAAGAATLNIQLQGSPDNATWVTYMETGALSIAQLNSLSAALDDIDLWGTYVPSRTGVLPRYYRLNYVVATGPFTAGTVGAWFGLINMDQGAYYPSGFNPAN